jgi:pilus assembly protein CpaC
VLGAEPGVQSVKVTTSDGRVETYTFTVHSVGKPGDPLAPGAVPAATDEALDGGTGPVVGRDAKSVAGQSTAIDQASAPRSVTVAPAASPPFSMTGVRTGTDAQSRPATPPSTAAPAVVTAQGATPKFITNPPAIDSEAEDATGGPSSLPDDTIPVRFGSSRVFNFPQRIKRVSIADTQVADLEVIDPHQLMLIGRKPGFTTLAVWSDQGPYQERQVRVEQSGRQQVMLNVVVAQLERDKLESQGIDYSLALAKYGVSLVGLPGVVASPYSASSTLSGGTAAASGILPSGGSIIPLLLSNNLTYGLAAQNSNVLTQTFFRFLEDNALARVLAQPRLVANSGEEAKFLSGGEIPIVIAQALNTTIVFKQFGTSVVFVPTVIGKHQIELVVKPEVSRPDFSQGVSLFGFRVPAFLEQKAETVVQMKENQTLILAGLIVHQHNAVVQKVPYLGDIPYAGGLFRNTTYHDDKTELVISVTPQIVRPIPANAEVAYPDRGPMTREEVRSRQVSPADAARPRF